MNTLSFDDLDAIQLTLDILGSALADHNHTWSYDERRAYEEASRLIKNAEEVPDYSIHTEDLFSQIDDLQAEIDYLDKKNLHLQDVVIFDLIERLSKYEEISPEQRAKISGINY